MTNLHPTRSNPNNIQPLFQPRILVVVKIILTLCFNLLTSFQHTREQFHKFGLRKHYWDDNTAECICATITYFGTCACWKPLRHGPEVITHFIYDEVKIYSYKTVRYYKAYCIMCKQWAKQKQWANTASSSKPWLHGKQTKCYSWPISFNNPLQQSTLRILCWTVKFLT